MPGAAKPFAISAPAVFDGGSFLHEHCVVVQGDSIEQVLPTADCPAGLETMTLAQGTLAPGFIDLQVNGGGGVLFNNTSPARHPAHHAARHTVPVALPASYQR